MALASSPSASLERLDAVSSLVAPTPANTVACLHGAMVSALADAKVAKSMRKTPGVRQQKSQYATKRVRMQGCVVFDHVEQCARARADWVQWIRASEMLQTLNGWRARIPHAAPARATIERASASLLG